MHPSLLTASLSFPEGESELAQHRYLCANYKKVPALRVFILVDTGLGDHKETQCIWR